MRKLTPQERENFKKNNPLAKKARNAKKKEDVGESLTQSLSDKIKNISKKKTLSPNEEMMRNAERDIIKHWNTDEG